MMLLLVFSVLLAPAAVYGLNLSVNVGASDDYCLPLLSFTWTLNDTMRNETNIGGFIGRLMSLDEDCAAVDLSFTIDEDETSFPIERNDNITYNCSYSFTLSSVSSGNNYTIQFSTELPAGLIVTDPVVSRYARFESDVDLSVSWNYINELFTSNYEARLVNGVGEILYHFSSLTQPFINGTFAINSGASTNESVYIQIRGVNNNCDIRSLWSEPLLLEMRRCYAFSQSVMEPLTESEAINRTRCYAKCVDEYASDAVRAIDSVWPMLDISSQNCSTRNEILQCYLGCVEKSKSPIIEDYECVDNCVTNCKNFCGGNIRCSMSDGSNNCERKCKYIPCHRGCQLYSPQSQGIPVPVAPAGHPTLLSNNVLAGGGYNISLRPINETVMEASATTVLLKIQSGQSTYYLWKDNLIFANLTFFNCRVVNISVAMVTGGGASSFSEPLGVHIYGETRFASHPTGIDIIVTEDFRPGFFGHAILNISWNKPTVNEEDLQFYQFELISTANECGGINRFLYNISKDTNNLIIMSSTPDSLPFFRCTYVYRLYSQPFKTGNIPRHRFLNLFTVTGPLPVTNLSCRRDQNETSGIITIAAKWTINPCDQLLMERILNFIVWNERFRKGFPFPFPRFRRIPKIDNNCAEYQTQFHFNPNIASTYDRFRVGLSFEVDMVNVTWRLVPARVNCLFSTRSDPPTVNEIQDLTLQSVTDSHININLTWSTPEITYGNIAKYTIAITTKPLVGDAIIPTNAIRIEANGNENEAVISELNIFPESVSCFYAQIRSDNGYNTSKWSESVIISKNDAICFNETINDTSSSMAVMSPSVTPTVTPTEDTKDTNIMLLYVVPTSSVAGVIILIVIAIIILFFCITCCRRRKFKKSFEPNSNEWLMMNKGSNVNSTTVHSPYSILRDGWEIDPSKIILETQLSEGAFGEVHKGYIVGPLTNPKLLSELRKNVTIPVAVKMNKKIASRVEKADLLNEIELMKLISERNNPHIVNMIGCVTVQEPIQLCMTIVKCGDLLNFLHFIRHRQDTGKENGTAGVHEDKYYNISNISHSDLLSFAYQIASGMEYLSSIGVIHRDLACRNVLIDEARNLRISDFGMSRKVGGTDEAYVKKTRGRLPWKWMAIESLAEREFTTLSDVWSYGVTLWEIVTLGGFPYPNVNNVNILNHLLEGYRLEKPTNCTQEIYDIMMLCWSYNSKERPTFSELKTKFDQLLSCEAEYIVLSVDHSLPYYNIIDEDLLSGEEEEEDSASGRVNEELMSMHQTMTKDK